MGSYWEIFPIILADEFGQLPSVSKFYFLTELNNTMFFSSAEEKLLQPLVTLQLNWSGVRALPLGIAAEQSVHYFGDYFSSSSVPHTLLPEGVVLGL